MIFSVNRLADHVACSRGCATQGAAAVHFLLDEPAQAQPLPEPPAPVEVVAVRRRCCRCRRR